MREFKLKKYFTKFVLVFLIMMPINSFASWYEEPEIYETENIDSMWWLSKSKKEKLKNEQKEEIEKKKAENKSKITEEKKIKWLYDDSDITRYPKDKWEVINDDNDGVGYNYYFDKDGFLLTDTITNDYRIVDKEGREVDYDFRPIKYNINGDKTEVESEIVTYEEDVYTVPTREPSKVLLGEGVTLRGKEKIYDNSINNRVIDYVDSSNRFIRETKGIVYNEVRWKNCSSLKGNGGYVVFNNPQNNFNKISGYISTEYFTDIDSNESFTLKVYDADLYDILNESHRLYDIEEIYQNNSFYQTNVVQFSFTFDRSIKRLRFVIETSENNRSLTCFMKDLKYGFSKSAFYDELIRKKENEAEIEELKRLGIYVKDLWSFEALDENGEVIEEDDEETEHENENNDDRIGGKSYVSEEETRDYEDVLRDRSTGPAFDESLQNGTTWRNSGPAFINIGTKSNIE